MSDFEGASPFPAPGMDFRQALDTTGPKGDLGGPMGVLVDRAGVFSAGGPSTSEPRAVRRAVQETVPARRNDLTDRPFTMNGDYNRTRREVTALLYIQEDEDYVRPTPYALDLGLELLEDTNAELLFHGRTFPRGTSSASERGGIYLFWEKDGVSIQLEVPPKDGGLCYIHIMTTNDSIMDRNVSAKTLASALASFAPSDSRRLGTSNAPASAVA